MSCRATGGGLSSGSTGCGGLAGSCATNYELGAAEPPNRRAAEPPNRRAIEPLTLYRRVASLALRSGYP
ncbi:hypothetical protein EYA88_34720 [Burkholderia pseudomallei]|nr:hypothetical protein EYA88_34720 [Burkholderia pseudomallei]